MTRPSVVTTPIVGPGSSLTELEYHGEFIARHVGPDERQIDDMLSALGLKNLDELIERTLPASIRLASSLKLPGPMTELAALEKLGAMMREEIPARSFIGLGYYNTALPLVILRNLLENPGWYTAYTPYQAEISQGRLESLLNYQQLIVDLTAMEIANASLLDEATAAAEAMAMAKRVGENVRSNTFFVDSDCFPQTIDVIRTRASYMGIEVVVDTLDKLGKHDCFGALLQYPGKGGEIIDLGPVIASLHQNKTMAIVAADLMGLVLLKPPGEMGADIVVGSSQRFGVPPGYGGPHAAYFATRDKFKRSIPGRIIGVSVDTRGKKAFRMALQTREQHIRREKANSNICTAQVLLANICAFYGVYHGPDGLRRIANRIHRLTRILAAGLKGKGLSLLNEHFFDTLTLSFSPEAGKEVVERAKSLGINLRVDKTDYSQLGLSLDECSDSADVEDLWRVLLGDEAADLSVASLDQQLASGAMDAAIPASLLRITDFLTHPNFNSYHSETEMLRYLKRLEDKDIALNRSMIALGSCTMKLNATAEMIPVTWPVISGAHPFSPLEQHAGYLAMIQDLAEKLEEITGFDAISMQPNSGAQGEYAGLVSIKRYLDSKGEGHRDVCLIPASAHGTNPASAQMVGMKVVVVACDKEGNVDITDLKAKVEQHKDKLAALMITYPSTHGVFEETVQEICALVHDHGGQVYMDGANMNAQVGLTSPGHIGADVCHLNLHKTFCIPHGGGGPGMGPIGVKSHLAPHLPGHVFTDGADAAQMAVSAAPFGSASILPISWMYITMMGGEGLTHATRVAILNANYVARKLEPHYPVLYKGGKGMVAHECIIDMRQLKAATGISEVDVAKRLMDFGFHAPTMSFPVPGTLMIEPTESESKEELDRFVEAMIKIREEIAKVEAGTHDAESSPLRHAPHTLADIMDDEWDRSYSRQEAAFPLPWLRHNKYWPSVNRVDDVYGDRNLFCTCPPLDEYDTEQ